MTTFSAGHGQMSFISHYPGFLCTDIYADPNLCPLVLLPARLLSLAGTSPSTPFILPHLVLINRLLGVCCCSLAAVSAGPPMPTLCNGRKATRCSSWAQETGTWKQSLASVHVSYCWCALLGQGMLLKHSVIEGLTTLLCWDFAKPAQGNPLVGSAGSARTSAPDFGC